MSDPTHIGWDLKSGRSWVTWTLNTFDCFDIRALLKLIYILLTWPEAASMTLPIYTVDNASSLYVYRPQQPLFPVSYHSCLPRELSRQQTELRIWAHLPWRTILGQIRTRTIWSWTRAEVAMSLLRLVRKPRTAAPRLVIADLRYSTIDISIYWEWWG